MKQLIKLEELGQFLLSIYLFSLLDYDAWVFLALLLLPDLSMIGYLINPGTGAWLYNLFHHKLLGILVLITGFWFGIQSVALAGVILFGHSSMDRIFGYGLKHRQGFKFTHLGVIGPDTKNK